ncbi:uncharacterized protein TNIN_380131 [Trichonephila inaurata madagascariensis]|uniref:Uncharacterized protein n=1 Tax=Trichonephila inaurata madagascariensis TaxID=2747483 RepID=A0A8X6YQP8_9ARAC|nr:uncharacterized protein TNIN_380131 [Trichonephila inaurata madagascariensis]
MLPYSCLDPEEERLRIVKAVAAIIREDIRSFVVETKSYPPPSKMLIKENQEIPKSLLLFLHEVIMKNRKGKIANSKTKCTSISRAIMAAIREQSFSSQLLLSLSVFLHGSERLIDVLYNLKFAASYGNTVQYEISKAYHPQSCIVSSELGSLVKYVGDNADINGHTLDGNNTLHVMGMINIITPKDTYDCIQKYATKPSAKELAARSHISLPAYEKPIVPEYSKIQVKHLHDDQALTEKIFNGVDFFVVIRKVEEYFIVVCLEWLSRIAH